MEQKFVSLLQEKGLKYLSEEVEELKESEEVLDELCTTNVQVQRGWVS